MPQSLNNAVPKWYTVLVFLSLVAIGFHFLLEHRLIFPALLSSARDMPFFHVRVLSRDIPLVLVIVVGGIPLLCQMALKLAHGQFGADLLAAIALVAAVSLQEYLAAVLIIVMLAGGQALEAYAMRKASSVLQALAERMPSTAHRKRGEHSEDIALSEIHLGEELIIYPHETCPVDGTVIKGHGSMDESYLTGEPYLVSKAPGVGVLSGAINGDTLLTIRAEKRATDSRYATIMRVMEEAEQQRPTSGGLAINWGQSLRPSLWPLPSWPGIAPVMPSGSSPCWLLQRHAPC
jgi:cation transport ATPase